MLTISNLAVPAVIAAILLWGLYKLKGKMFTVFLQGAGEGARTALSILPALVLLMTAIGMFQASGALELFTRLLSPAARLLGIPEQLIPLGVIRPISGSGATALLEHTLSQYGPDSFLGRAASVMAASTETSCYVIALYFGAAGITKTRHALPAALAGDLISMVLAVLTVKLLYGPV